MKLRLPLALFRAVMACFSAFTATSAATATACASGVSFSLPDVEQTDSMFCWAASAADVLAAQTGQDAASIYRCLTQASGHTPGYVETALSWYMEGASGELLPQEFDGSHTVSRQGFDSPQALALALREALSTARAASLMLRDTRGEGDAPGHAVTIYACEVEGGQLILRYADSADGVQGIRRAAVLPTARGLMLEGTPFAVESLAYLGEDAEDSVPAAPVAGIMHSSPYLQEYTDMAENRGVYRFAYMPSIITYRNGEADYSLPVTPDYSSVADMGCYTLLYNGNAQMTVEHNGIMNGATYTGRYVGEYAQKYSVAGIRGNATFTFGTKNPYVPTHDDYRIERMTRLVTDTGATDYCTDENLLSHMPGVTVYRVGAGKSGYYDTAGNFHELTGVGWVSGMTAGITSLMEQIFYVPETGIIGIQQHPADFEQTSAADPLPSVGLQGDSGSPVFIYNEETGRMELVATLANADTTVWQAYYSPRATAEMESFCTVSIGTSSDFNPADAAATTIYLSGAKVGENDELLQDGAAATYLRKGTISLNGETIATYNGVALEEFSQGTWKKLDADSLTWYTYSDNDYLNVKSDTATDANTFGTDDLVYTSNLNFVADAAGGATTAHRSIELTENVDLGIGHVQFSLGEGVTAATFDLGKANPDYQLSSAGFVVDAGVTLNNYLTFEKGRELRRVGLGTMNMVGTGNNDVLLNLGGGGVTFLNRTDGYAAYSVLVNSQAVLRLADAGQVYNNVTLGANGGVLDFHGNDYRWTSGGARAEGSDGKTWFGLTVYEGLNRVETSTLANYKEGSSSTITIERSGDFEFAGAFRDGSTYTGSGKVEMDSRYTMMPSVLLGLYKQYCAADRQDSTSTLRVIYNGGGTLSMTGVYTLLTGDSGLEVASGTVSLHGTNTIHAIGSASGTNTNRLQNADDWHYAMAEMNVMVDAGATFELGDHALLIGDVQVAQGGTYVMTQAVNQRHEYVEGWVLAEDTYALADYYGHKGNVSLASGAAMELVFDDGVATELRYGGNISGEGSLLVDAGEGSVYLTGRNDFSGEKTLASGSLRLAEGAVGNTSTHQWLVQEQGVLALEGVSTNAQLESRVDASSTGVLALTQDFAEQVSLSGLIIGAADGEAVHYGSSGQSLAASGGQWTLGGGGGTLYVDFLLEGENTLVVGNAWGKGTVVLTNAGNSFSGGIELPGGVVLGYTSTGALGSNVLTIGYGSTLSAVDGAAFAAGNINTSSSGVFALSDGTQDYDLSQHSSLALAAHGAATLSGSLSVAEGAAYRLGGAGELTLATTLSGNHGIVVDGQGTTGSRVIFSTASEDTGAVLVQGYDASAASSGNVVLTFGVDNALAAASSVTLQNNAGMDLAGTNQLFHNLSGDASCLMVDAVGGNTITLHSEGAQTLASGVQAAGSAMVKEGSGTLTLSGENHWKSLTINAGAVQVTQGLSLEEELNVAGYGADGASVALRVEGELYNSRLSLNATADAAISGSYVVGQLDMQGNSLTLTGSDSSLTVSGMRNGTLRVVEGASLQFGKLKLGAGVALELNQGTMKVANGSFAGTLTVGANGGTIEFPWNNSSTEAFNMTGLISGTFAESTLKLVAHNHTINLSGGVDFAGSVEVGNGVTLNISKDASVGALINESNVGDLSTVAVNGATLTLTGSGSNFGSNGNAGNLELGSGGVLCLSGLASGDSLGTLGSLKMGTDGVLTFASFGAYTGSTALMSIDSIDGTRRLQIDAATLGELVNGSTYRLLSSAQDLSGWTLLNNTSGARQTLELVSGGTEGAYTLDLLVSGGQIAHATWKGTGTLTEGSAHENLNSSAGDSTLMAMDTLSISSDAGSEDTLTLGGTINASSVSVTGAGTVTLAQENGGKFADGLGVLLDGPGKLVLGDTKAISGEIELKQGTLSAGSDSLNVTQGLRVTGDATFELTTASHVTAGIDIAAGKTLTLNFKADSMADQWGGNFDDSLSGSGTLAVAIGSGNELHLNGNHAAFTGAIDVQSGTLQLGMREDNGQLLSSTLGARSISMAAGTTLSLSSSATTLGADISWAGGSTLHVKDGAASGVAYTLSGQQTLAGVLNITSAASRTLHLTGNIVGDSGSLNFSGASTFVLSGDNSYGGGTTLNNSGLTVYAAHAHALGTGLIQLQSGTLAWQGVGRSWNGDLSASGIEVSGDGVLNSNGQDVTYSGAVSGTSGSLTKSGKGTLALTNFSYTGATHVQEGTLALGISKSSWYKGFSGDEGATLKLTSTSPYGTYLMGSMSGGMAVELSGDFAYSASNTHTGGTKLLSGSLDIGHLNALLSGSLHAAEGTTVTVRVAGAFLAGNSEVDALVFDSGASLVIGTDAAAGHLSFGSLSGTASFLLDFFSADSYDRLSGTLTPGSLLAVDLKEGASAAGSYLLVAGDNSGYDTSGITLSGKDESQYTYAWLNTQEGLALNILDFATGSRNVWTGGTSGSWDSSSTAWNGNGGTFNAALDTLIQAGVDTSIRVTEAVSTGTLTTEVAEGATLSLSNDGGSISATTLQKDGDGTLSFTSGSVNSFGSVIINDGTLSLSAANGNPLGTTNISGNGTFELSGGSLSAAVTDFSVTNISLRGDAVFTPQYSGSNFALENRYISVADDATLLTGHWCGVKKSTILLKEGGRFVVGSVGLSDNNILVEGTATLAIGQTSSNDDGNDFLETNSTISGSGDLFITNYTNKSNSGYSVDMSGVISDAADGGKLAIRTDEFSLTLSGSNSYSGGTTISGGKVTTKNASALGTGSVTLNGGTLKLDTALNIGSLSGTAGTLETGAHELHINQTQAGEFAGSISGSATITKSGAAALSLTGSVSAQTLVVQEGILNVRSATLSTDTLDMTQAGTALNIGSLTLSSNATLAYSSALVNVNIGSLTAQGSLTLSFAESLREYLFGKTDGAFNILDLGADFSDYVGSLIMTGLDAESASWTLGTDATTGHSTLQFTADKRLLWDENWGLAGAPATGEHIKLTATGGFANTAYDDGTRIVVAITGTEGSSPLDLYATSADGSAASRHAWVEVEGGSFGLIAGAKDAAVTGNMHVSISGGSVNDVVGFGVGSRTYTGDTYISVYDGVTVYDSVIGGAVLDTGTLDGSTHVYIYSLLDTNAESLSGSGVGYIHNAVIGGLAHSRGNGQAWNLTGDTNVTVDLSAHTEAGARFVKAIYGGSVANTHWGNIDGHSSVLINAGDNVTFTDDIVAGSRQKGATGVVRIMKDSTLTINGGTYAGGSDKFLTGGNVIDDCEGVLTGQASVLINGGIINREVYGAGVNKSGAAGVTVGSSRVVIGGDATLTEQVAAGGKVAGGTLSISGDSTLTINGGMLTGTLTAGSVVSGGSSTIGGTASVLLNGGTINGNVYAAGIHDPASGKSTVGATRVEIGKDAVFGQVTVSGAFGGSNTGSTYAEVTGNRTLALLNGVNLSSTAATFKAFDSVDVASGTASLNAGALELVAYTKTGAGTLELGGTAGSSLGQIDVAGGTLKLTSGSALSSAKLIDTVLDMQHGTLDINGQTSYNNSLFFDNYNGYIKFTGDGDMLIKDSSGSASSGLGFYTVQAYSAVTYSGTGRAEISANIVNGGQSTPSNKMKFNVSSAGKGADFTELTLSGNIGADHSANERYMFGIAKAGAGTMLLSGNNGYAGGTEVLGGTLIAASDTALGSGALSVSSGATLEITAGTHLSLTGNISFGDGATLTLGSVDATQAVLATSGTLTLNGGLTLNIGSTMGNATSYSVLSGAGGYSQAGSITVNYSGDGRYNYTTRYDSNTLYLDAVLDDNTTLVWNGTAESGTWNQAAQNTNWNRTDESAPDTSFMDLDDVSFTASASNKNVVVADAGVQVNSMKVEADGYSFSGGSVQANEVLVTNGSSTSFGEVYTISQKDTGSSGSMGQVQMGADVEAGTGFIHGVGEGLSALDNVVIDIAKGAQLALENVLITDSTRITDDPATVALNNVAVAVSKANASMEGAVALASGTTLAHAYGGSNVTLSADTQVYTLFCSAFDTVNLTGTSLTIDLSGYAAELAEIWKSFEYVSISFGQTADSLAHFDTTQLNIVATYDGVSFNSVYVAADNLASAATLYISTSAVPEPTTATLSLLALSLLAARRRRKA